jgi:hypothetical protein
MGWLWSTLKAAAAPSSQGQAIPSSQSESEHPVAPHPAPAKAPASADQELQSFLQEIEADTRPSSTKYNRIPKQPPSSGAPASTPSNEPLSEQLLPTTMSCREAFDSAFYCNSLGGQFNNLYRYGTVGACSENWDNFWFCMRTRGFGDRERQEAIRGRYREKEKRRYGRDEFGKSSEDVWKTRDKKVELGKAFNGPFPDFSGTDEEWNRMERETRAKLRANTSG